MRVKLLCQFLLASLAFGQAVAAETTALSKGSPAPAAASPAAPAPQSAPTPTADSNVVKGITRCAADLSLGLPVTGRIAEIPVQEGTVVKPGQVLLQLDRGAEQLDVERRRLQWQGKAELEHARARLETTESQMVAARRIYASSQGISKEELDNRELAYKTAAAELQRLTNQKDMERLDYLTAKENLERRTLRAPTKGIVTRLIKQVGESVQSNEPAIRMCDLSKILFVVNVPATRSDYLRTGETVELQVGAGKPAAMRGKLIFVSPVVDPASGLREVKIELINPGADVRPGVPATLTLKS